MTAVLTAGVIDVFCAGPKFTKTEKLTAPNNVKSMQGMYILGMILLLLFVAVVHYVHHRRRKDINVDFTK